METNIRKHFDEDTLELYAMGKLPEQAIPSLEEHLMVCRECQVRLEQVEDFLDIAQAASGQVKQAETVAPRKGMEVAWLYDLPKPVWAGAFAALALTLTIPAWHGSGNGAGAVTEVELQTSRGLGDEAPINVANGRVVVVADISELRQLPSYLVKLVDQNGSEVWRGTAQAVNQKIRQQISKPVAPGHYWVRVLSSDGTDLLREYSLQVK